MSGLGETSELRRSGSLLRQTADAAANLVANYLLSRDDPGGNLDTTPNGAFVGGIVAVVVLAVASARTLIPATRAACVNPVTALRSE